MPVSRARADTEFILGAEHSLQIWFSDLAEELVRVDFRLLTQEKFLQFCWLSPLGQDLTRSIFVVRIRVPGWGNVSAMLFRGHSQNRRTRWQYRGVRPLLLQLRQARGG